MNITISSALKLYRATEYAPAKNPFVDINEPTSVVDEISITLIIPSSGTVSIPLGGITLGHYIYINGKPSGGTTDVKLAARITNSLVGVSGVTSGAQDIRFDKQLLVTGAEFTALSILNLDTLNPVTVTVYLAGE